MGKPTGFLEYDRVTSTVQTPRSRIQNYNEFHTPISEEEQRHQEELRKQGLQGMTEVKFENTINRATAVANPRQIERVIRGTIFGLDIIYEVMDEREAVEDFSILAEGFRLLQYDYLGGSGSRGYGKVVFHDLRAETVVGGMSDDILTECNRILQEAAGR